MAGRSFAMVTIFIAVVIYLTTSGPGRGGVVECINPRRAAFALAASPTLAAPTSSHHQQGGGGTSLQIPSPTIYGGSSHSPVSSAASSIELSAGVEHDLLNPTGRPNAVDVVVHESREPHPAGLRLEDGSWMKAVFNTLVGMGKKAQHEKRVVIHRQWDEFTLTAPIGPFTQGDQSLRYLPFRFNIDYWPTFDIHATMNYAGTLTPDGHLKFKNGSSDVLKGQVREHDSGQIFTQGSIQLCDESDPGCANPRAQFQGTINWDSNHQNGVIQLPCNDILNAACNQLCANNHALCNKPIQPLPTAPITNAPQGQQSADYIQLNSAPGKVASHVLKFLIPLSAAIVVMGR